MAPSRKALIIGAGVAGPAAALLLRRAGIESEIYEAQATPDDYRGLFLNVASNGLAVLHELGLEAELAAAGFRCPWMVMWSGSGKRLAEVRNGAAEGQGPASLVIKRSALHRILREAAEREAIPIYFGKRLIDVELDADRRVTARFDDGTQAEGDLLLGCDGLHSRVRQIIDPGAPAPVYTGLVSCGGFTRQVALPPTPDTQHFIFGRRAFFGYLVKPDGEIYWFNNLAYPGTPRRAELEAIPEAEWRERLLALHRDDQSVIRQIIRATEGAIGRYPIYDIPSLPRWRRGPLVLLGDAAHATSPSAGQGAALALEDALVLAKCLRDRPTTSAAFALYEQLRRERAERVVRLSRQIGNHKATSNPIARWIRDLVLPVVLKRFNSPAQHGWLYAYREPWATPVAEPGRNATRPGSSSSSTIR
ncbi:FAD-dependent oxidoreductase [Kallotenue papyrolyticum]|uniref:FAD-dependent oxidoreductase n=1 Tax=Kallotenue papyrolyticum TaxID=1325125 RepID=UPI000492671A|nr:NAD(P)/FAD-dependent oxidoreductase [Kallotenue papyrolyticum]